MLEREHTVSVENYVYPPGGTADASIIWLHGLGADGKDFVAIKDQLGLAANHTVRFIFPNAPFRPITINNGMVMRGWYDVYQIDILANEDSTGIVQANQLLQGIIEQELQLGIESTRIILAGFSQGGAVCLHSGLRLAQPLAGIIALSTYQPLACTLAQERHLANQQVPIFLAHGLFDPVIPLNFGKKTMQQLRNLNYNVTWRTYPMQHTATEQEIIDIGNFIQQCLND